tara:strand:- start:54 stop:323 length:270 start_codon:yes stop_codon:yes gene_type:complete
VFSNAIGISGIASLIAFMITDLLLYLKVASILSITVIGLIFILSAQALYSFGLDKCYLEIEAKFLDLTLYSSLILVTLFFLLVELFGIS